MTLAEPDPSALSDTAKELLSRAAELRPLLERNAPQGEADRRIPDEMIDALAAAGLFRITVPRRLGGYEIDIRTKLEVSAATRRRAGARSSGTSLARARAKRSTQFMRTAPEFAANPIGVPVDPDRIIAAWREGAADAELHERAYAGEFSPEGALDLRLPAPE